MGHAAGQAAAMAAHRDAPVRDLDVRDLQDRVRTDGACLEINQATPAESIA
jgi:hypothetical protein